jgi:hypothetical protein
MSCHKTHDLLCRLCFDLQVQGKASFRSLLPQHIEDLRRFGLDLASVRSASTKICDNCRSTISHLKRSENQPSCCALEVFSYVNLHWVRAISHEDCQACSAISERYNRQHVGRKRRVPVPSFQERLNRWKNTAINPIGRTFLTLVYSYVARVA